MANVKYSKDKPQKLIEAMRKGHSFTGALGEIGIGKTQGFAWVDKYPAFAKAKEEGDAFSLNFIEKCAISALTGVIPESLKRMGSKRINVTMAIFMMKTRFHHEYGERMKLEGSEKDENGNENTVKLAFDPTVLAKKKIKKDK